MKPARFDYIRVESADEAAACLRDTGEDARILAGGQSLMAILNMRLAAPRVLIDIGRTRALAYVRTDAGQLVIGAAATQADVEWRGNLTREVPLLALAFPHVAHFQIRNRGTVCGSIAHADPSAELPLIIAALDGAIVLRNAKRRRTVRAQEFFTGMLSTERALDELIEEVRFPLAGAGEGFGFEEYAARHGDFAAAAIAVIVSPRGIRIAVGGVGDRPAVHDLPRLEDDALDDALNEIAWSLDARDDPHVSARARRHLVRTLGRRAVAQAQHASTGARLQPGAGPSQVGDSPSGGPRAARGGNMKRYEQDRRHAVALRLNGVPRAGHAEPRMLLSDFLRHELGATGTHVGCEHGVCGACTVQIDGVATRACLTLAVQVNGCDVGTVEGLAAEDATLSELQAAFKRHHALQCGFCTAGILMSATDFLRRVPAPSEQQVREMLSGHLCRCTGYTPIVAAILDVARQRSPELSTS